MPVPTLKPTVVQDETFAGITYHIQGELGPVLTVEVSDHPVYFEHHILLWKDIAVNVGIKNLQGAFKRAIHGMPIYVVETHGSGRIGFSRNGPGHLLAIHLRDGESLDVREHQWVAATNSLDFSFMRVSGIANMVFAGTGLFIDTFTCSKGPEGILWLHGYGNVFELTLEAGEQIDLEPGAWIYKDRAVTMDTVVQRLSTGFLAGSGQLVVNRFTGPGRIGFQSLYMYIGSSDQG